ncbi:MAG: hypothetical protein AB7O38_14410 [Pirellulaceae bacterium]
MLMRYGAATVFAVAMMGCGQNGPGLSSVEGVVTLEGIPLSGATVIFSPIHGGTGRAATGVTDELGKFYVSDLEEDADGCGAVAGDYQVGIVKVLADPAASCDSWKTDPNYGKDTVSHTQTVSLPSAIPVLYNNPRTSGLTAHIAPGTNTLNFDLKKSHHGLKTAAR